MSKARKMPRTARSDLGNLLMAAFILVILLLGAIYGNTSFAAQDWLWFKRGFDEPPARIVVYHNGQRTELRAGQAGFDELAGAIQASLAQGVAQQSSIGLSDVSLQEAYALNVTLEVFFDRPVKLHAGYNTGHPTQMLFPITGRHSDLPIVFLGGNGQYAVNAPLLKTVEPIRKGLKLLGY